MVIPCTRASPPAATRPWMVVPPVLAVIAPPVKTSTARHPEVGAIGRMARPGSTASAADHATQRDEANLRRGRVSDRHPGRVATRAPTRQLAVVSICRRRARRPDTAGDRRRPTTRRQTCRSTCSFSSPTARARPRARRGHGRVAGLGHLHPGRRGCRRLRSGEPLSRRQRRPRWRCATATPWSPTGRSPRPRRARRLLRRRSGRPRPALDAPRIPNAGYGTSRCGR